MTGRGALVGVDWGTSSMRAFLLDADGAILDRREGPFGILHVEKGDFAGLLSAQVGAWLGDGTMPVLLSGMIGSRQGWSEAPYLELPAGIGDLAAALISVPFDQTDVRIVAGVKDTAGEMFDVVRAEEVQVLGAMARLGVDRGCFVLPGTHSKWMHAQDNRLTGFSTYMTGEVYRALRDHTILGRLMEDADSEDHAAFAQGVHDGAKAGTPGSLLHRLFGVRTAGLFAQQSAAGLSDYLSGLLIGSEIADQLGGEAHDIYVIASAESLGRRYQEAAEMLGMTTQTVEADSVVDGHMAIARLAGMI